MLDVLWVEYARKPSEFPEHLSIGPGTNPIAITRVGKLSLALQCLAQEKYDVFVLDLDLLDTHGAETINQLQTAMGRLPIIILARLGHEDVALQAMQHGAQDYIVKHELTDDLLVSAIQKAVVRKQAERNFTYIAQTDFLTDVANRALFVDRYKLAVARSKRRGQTVAVMHLGLDHFTEVNDMFGREGGDCALRTAALRLKSSVREVDTVARLRGDEFLILLEALANPSDYTIVCERIQCNLSFPIPVGDQKTTLTVSIGITLVPAEGRSIEEVLQETETAMVKCKQQGGNAYRLYTPDEDPCGPPAIETEATSPEDSQESSAGCSVQAEDSVSPPDR